MWWNNLGEKMFGEDGVSQKRCEKKILGKIITTIFNFFQKVFLSLYIFFI